VIFYDGAPAPGTYSGTWATAMTSGQAKAVYLVNGSNDFFMSAEGAQFTITGSASAGYRVNFSTITFTENVNGLPGTNTMSVAGNFGCN
jgi:hypothetical protein